MNMDIGYIFEHSPPFAKGIWFVLAVMSLWSLTVAFGKWWNLRKAQAETLKFAPEFSQFLEEDNLAEAINLAQSYKKSHVARVLGGALDEVKPLILDGSVTVSDINSAERAVERNMLVEMDRTDDRPDPVLIPGNPVKMSRVSEGPETRVPWIGEHTDDVLISELGLGADELASLRADGVIN